VSAPILIAGAGIGGLSAAIALRRLGRSARVLERQPRDEGGGIQLGPNATRILKHWEILPDIEAAACRPSRIDIYDGLTGKTLNSVPLGARIEARHGAPYLTMRRADLYKILLQHAQRPPNTYREMDAAAFTQCAGGITVSARDQAVTESGAALIGADGVGSTIRQRLNPGLERASPMAYTAWRATAADERWRRWAGSVSLWLRPDMHLVHYEAGNDMNLVCVTGPAHSGPLCVDLWPPVIRDCLPRPELWTAWRVPAFDDRTRWTDGLVTLLGDAVHPIAPFLASGASMAIEDAHVLASVLEKHVDPAESFALYEKMRRPRVARVAARSRRMGEIYHMSGVMRLARNAVIAATPPGRLLARNDWLYGFRV
jgi:salicylate hydroxylase